MDKATLFLKDKLKEYSNPSIVVACSGGPDSMALLNLCLELRKEIDINIVCAHVNHNVREESASEKVFVEDMCKKNNIIFEYMKIENYSDDNFENEARTKRYTYFEELLKKYKAPYLLTAHHGDDLIETVLMRITRGSTLKGYSGFSNVVEKNGYTILRPLIYYTKAEIIEYNHQNGLEYCIDKTNEMDIHTRNRYRKYILPRLKDEDSNVHEKFYKFSNMLLEYNNYINSQVSEYKKQVYVDNKLLINKFLELDKIIKMHIIYDVLEEHYQDDLMVINDKHVKMMIDLAESTKANMYVHLPNNIKAVKAYNVLYLTKEDVDISDYEVELSELVILPNGKEITITKDLDNNSNFVCRLDSKELVLPLIVRNRRIGDKMMVMGMNGYKKIKDIFIDEKVLASDRDLWPVVTDSKDRIVWLPGLKKSQFNKKKSEKYDIIIKYD